MHAMKVIFLVMHIRQLRVLHAHLACIRIKKGKNFVRHAMVENIQTKLRKHRARHVRRGMRSVEVTMSDVMNAMLESMQIQLVCPRVRVAER